MCQAVARAVNTNGIMAVIMRMKENNFEMSEIFRQSLDKIKNI